MLHKKKWYTVRGFPASKQAFGGDHAGNHIYTNKAKSLYNLIIISYHKYIHFLIILSENLTELEWLRPLKKKQLLNGGYAWVYTRTQKQKIKIKTD